MVYRDYVDTNPKVFTIWSFSKKSLPSPDLDKKYCLSHKGIAFFINEQIKSLFNKIISYKTA